MEMVNIYTPNLDYQPKISNAEWNAHAKRGSSFDVPFLITPLTIELLLCETWAPS